MSKDNETGWILWARNGRLSTLVWGATFIAWLAFKVAKIPLEGLDTVFVIMSGAWVTNLGISTVKPGSANTKPPPAEVKADDAHG